LDCGTFSPESVDYPIYANQLAETLQKGKASLGRKSLMEKFFKVAERGSNPAQEFRAGITTFLAMAYIIAVNPALLAAAGVPVSAAITATCLGGGIMGQEAILKPKIRTALKAALVPSLAEKTRLEFAHHQNTAGMLGAYYHFILNENQRAN